MEILTASDRQALPKGEVTREVRSSRFRRADEARRRLLARLVFSRNSLIRNNSGQKRDVYPRLTSSGRVRSLSRIR